MRFIVMHKVDAQMEAGVAPPDRELVKTMGALIGESLRAKIFLDGAGLHRSARRVRLRCEAGHCTVERGPYEGRNELVADMFLIKTRSLDEATEQAKRFGAVLGDVDIEVGPVVEAWDLTGAPKPADVVDEKFLLLVKGDADYERGQPRDAEREAALRRLTDDLSKGGVLLKREGLAPSKTGARLSGPKGQRTWTDGPFAESKELIAGFSILGLPSRADAITWANRYADILVDCEVDVRELVE